MRMKVLLVALLTTAACVPKSPVAPSQGPWRFSGTVLATDGVRIGSPIAGAVLTVVSGVNSNTKVTSDGAGRFAFAALAADTFDVTVAASGYVSATPRVNLYRDIDADFALKPQ
jgi:hypothetical protein